MGVEDPSVLGAELRKINSFLLFVVDRLDNATSHSALMIQEEVKFLKAGLQNVNLKNRKLYIQNTYKICIYVFFKYRIHNLYT